MNILLVNPSLIQTDIGHYSKKIEKQRGIYPPLGLAYIAASLLKAGHGVKIIDCDAEENYLEKIKESFKNFKPQAIGFLTFTWTYQQTKQLASLVKKINPEIKTIIGGPNVSSFPRLSLELGDFDFGVKGEGEITIVELAAALEQEKNFENILGLIYKNGAEIIENQDRPYVQNLDEIPRPARHLLPMDKYFDVFTREKKFTTIIGSRGCPFNCTFCDRKNRMGRRWRIRSPENIIGEIQEIQTNYGIREFMFFDDNFIVNQDITKKFCELIISEDLNIIWECRTRVDLMDKELLSLMKKAGCYRIRYGFEAGNNQILKILKKDITREQSLECAKMTKEVGIEMIGYFMMGTPAETKETMQETLDLALKIDPSFAVFSKVILIPGSELFDWAAENGYIEKDYWEKFLKGEVTNPAPALSTQKLPKETIEEFVSFSNKKFYLRPKYILRKIGAIRSPGQFTRQLKMAQAILFP